MRSPIPVLRGGAAVLAALLISLAAGPAVATVAGALAPDARSHCERMGHTMPEERPDEAPMGASCCMAASETAAVAVVPAPLPDLDAAVALAVLAPPVAAPSTPAPPPDTGPPPGPRRHLALSVLLV